MNELFLPEYTTGTISSISFFANIIGGAAVFVLSLTGFGIVYSAIIKNALSGLYWTNPRLWDKVDQVKRANLNFIKSRDGVSAANGSVGSNNQVMLLLGSLSSLVLSMLLNVKELSEFGIDENGNEVKTDPKHYFMKALPMCVVCIFVGVFIWKGYPSQVANKFAETGTGIFDLVLTNTDPIAFVEKLPTKFAMYKLSTDTAKDDVSEVVNSAAKKAIQAYLGTFTDVEKAKRNAVALEIESWLIPAIEANAQYCDSDKYSVSLTAQIDNLEVDMSRYNGVENDGVWQFAYRTPVDTFNSGTVIDTTNKYLRVNMVCTPKASKGNTKSVECNLTLPRNSASYNASTKTLTIDIGQSEGTGFGFSQRGNAAVGSVSANGKSVSVVITASGTTFTVKAKDNKTDIAGATTITGVNGITYNYGSSAHPVRSISCTGSGSATFSPVDTESGISSWSWGEGPVSKSDANTGNDSENLETTSDNEDSDDDWD